MLKPKKKPKPKTCLGNYPQECCGWCRLKFPGLMAVCGDLNEPWSKTVQRFEQSGYSLTSEYFPQWFIRAMMTST